MGPSFQLCSGLLICVFLDFFHDPSLQWTFPGLLQERFCPIQEHFLWGEAGTALPLHITNFHTHKFNLVMSTCWSGALCPGQSSDNGPIHQEASWAPVLDCGVRVTALFLSSSLFFLSYSWSNLWLWWADHGQLPDAHPAARSVPLLNRSGEKIIWRKALG